MSLWTEVFRLISPHFFSIIYIVSKILTEAGVSCVLCNKTRHTARKGTDELYFRVIPVVQNPTEELTVTQMVKKFPTREAL